MSSPRLLARIDTLVWVLIFGGLFTLVLGIATHGEAEIAGWSLTVLGTLAAAAGVVLIFVRARLSEPGAGAQSSPKRPRDQA
jgi:hypothetical protein